MEVVVVALYSFKLHLIWMLKLCNYLNCKKYLKTVFIRVCKEFQNSKEI